MYKFLHLFLRYVEAVVRFNYDIIPQIKAIYLFGFIPIITLHYFALFMIYSRNCFLYSNFVRNNLK